MKRAGWLVAFVSAVGGGACHQDRNPLLDAAVPDAAVPDAPFSALCPAGDPVTITGTTPRGNLDRLRYRNVLTFSGFCSGIGIVYTSEPTFGFPEPRPILSVDIAQPNGKGMPMGGDLEARVRFVDDAGDELETTGTFSADLIEPLGTGNRIRGRLVVDDAAAGWSIDLAVDAVSCHHDVCF